MPETQTLCDRCGHFVIGLLKDGSLVDDRCYLTNNIMHKKKTRKCQTFKEGKPYILKDLLRMPGDRK